MAAADAHADDGAASGRSRSRARTASTPSPTTTTMQATTGRPPTPLGWS